MTPVLYSFRRCPYAIRARLAIHCAGLKVELREVVLRDKPAALLHASPKGTVPVLLPGDGSVIDESRDIMRWALTQHDPQNWLGDAPRLAAANELIDVNDCSFKPQLDRYKYADRHPQSAEHYRSQGESFLQALETRLARHRYLLGDQVSLADMAIFPFIRQFVQVDSDWFRQAPYGHLQQWLQGFLDSKAFAGTMIKYPAWQPADQPQLFP